MEDIFYTSADGVTQIHACIWRPAGEILGVVQIIHGMSEYAQRYSPFAQFLADNGFLVCAEDHLGHGKSVTTPDNLGWFNKNHDYNTTVADIRTLHEKMKAEAAGLPYFVFGHSMGSFFCRKYISLYGAELDGAVVAGTGFQGKALMNVALLMTRLNALFFGWKNRSKFIKQLAFGSYNKRFKGEGGNAWFSVDKDNTAAYDSDPLCGFDFTNNGYYVLFSIIKTACTKSTIKAVPKDLPVYFVAGRDDPVGNYGKGVAKAYNSFVKSGVKDSKITLYNGRHEILNDFCKAEVQADLLEFFLKNSTRSAN